MAPWGGGDWGPQVSQLPPTSSPKNVKYLLSAGAGTGQYDLRLSIQSVPPKMRISVLGSFMRPSLASNPNLYVVCSTRTV